MLFLVLSFASSLVLSAQEITSLGLNDDARGGSILSFLLAPKLVNLHLLNSDVGDGALACSESL